ncbi:class II SORL domain-containing protein [Candidatus Omnitrophota bacterium]
MSEQHSCESDILCGLNMPKDANTLTELEQKHMPVIDAPEKVGQSETFEVTIEVGKLKAHPNEPAHSIEWVELYCGDTFIFRINLAGSLSSPKVTLPITLTHAHGPLKARAKCNMHGLWEGIKDIQVQA